MELLAGLSGETLATIAKRMEREEVPPGRSVVREGDEAERFYVVLSGLFAVSQEDLGPLTQAVVASCDRATFDELLRPLFSDDQPSA